ncbi:CoA transferase [Shinella sp. PSBB067]|uniref:CaiB/BaiF CoA transferase family protein n=1 Tax=Shinella sp. PSBB067 TaxID=2715959 RepID=UPI00193B826C|nr:CaiB/BaiF CoA-transferase family protein [Shinella sp. PSBB067]QRI63817.1 CoA transferase [Shinella sp. PSBB067]
MTAPLDGIKVLDLSRFIAGPHCTKILGDMGADVIKVEKVGYGDDGRHFPPFQNGESLYGMSLNRNKRSMVLDFRHADAPQMLIELARQADVLVENFRPGTMEQMGCGWDVLHAANPRLVMTRLSGFGQDGPYAMRPGFDGIAQAMSGLMSLAGEPEGPPMLAGTFYVDYMTGMYGANATVAALYARERTGKGQMIDVALLDSAVSMLTTGLSSQADQGVTPLRTGNRDRYSSPANVFSTGSGEYVLIVSGTNPLFARICAMIGKPELVQDPRFETVPLRLQNAAAIEDVVQAWCLEHDTQAVIEALNTYGIPACKIATMKDVVENPQLHHRGQLVEMEHPKAGKITLAGVTMHLSDTPLAIRRPPPVLGEHTDEILGDWLGLDEDAIEALREKRLIQM